MGANSGDVKMSKANSIIDRWINEVCYDGGHVGTLECVKCGYEAPVGPTHT